MNIMSTGAAENAVVRELRKTVLSEMSKQKYLRAGQAVRQHFEGPSSRLSVPSDRETLELQRFGVMVMLAGGVETCMRMSGVAEVKEVAAAVHSKSTLASHEEQQKRADFMELAEKGDPKGRVIYALGCGAQYYYRWKNANKGQRDSWRTVIIAAADAVRDIVGSCDY